MAPAALSARETRAAALVAAGLLTLAFLAYVPVLGNGFVVYDDQVYVVENQRVRAGLTWDNVRWAFTSTEIANWFPLTRLSHLVDVQLFGLRPAGHHLSSLLLHLANTALVFLVLRAMTAALWRSALVAALFALHPLHVESVAWVAERKDVLCAFFWLLAMAAYLRYARRPSLGRYALVFALVAGSLMAKALAVTLPFALLLLDFWPLRRAGPRGASARGLLLEKLPLFALSAGAAVMAYRAQEQGEAMTDFALYTPAMRAGNAVLAYLRYLEKTFWPQNLSVLYFYHSQSSPAAAAALAATALAAVTLLALLLSRRRPYYAIGWLWFLGVLVPMIGIVQVGIQAFADRYTYLPHLGLFIMIAWGLGDIATRWPRARVAAAGACALGLSALILLTANQVLVWRSTTTLFRQALEVSPDNLIAEMNLARALTKEGKLREGNEHLLRVLARFPRMPFAHQLLGLNALHQGDPAAAKSHFASELEIDPRNADAHLHLASLLEQEGRLPEARLHYERYLRLEPGSAVGRRSLGLLAARQGDWAFALGQLLLALEVNPNDAEVRARALEATVRLGRRRQR